MFFLLCPESWAFRIGEELKGDLANDPSWAWICFALGTAHPVLWRCENFAFHWAQVGFFVLHLFTFILIFKREKNLIPLPVYTVEGASTCPGLYPGYKLSALWAGVRENLVSGSLAPALMSSGALTSSSSCLTWPTLSSRASSPCSPGMRSVRSRSVLEDV